MAALFATTLFLSASLVFSVQPMLAKMILPLLGGTPAVWNTCMVFFQVMLLLGYAYAHWLGNRTTLFKQILVQIALLLAAAWVLPLSLSARVFEGVPNNSNPTGWLFKTLFLTAGLPFFAIAANGPLLQRWFSRSRHPSAGDPYFLYAASNLGSLLALLAYPLLLEPYLRLPDQSGWWRAGFLWLILLIAGCGLMLLRKNGAASGQTDFSGSASAQSESEPAQPISGRQRLRWSCLAAVPSSLMLGVTTYLTTDIASLPLLWILPLCLYLLSFIVVFAPGGARRSRWSFRVLPIGVVALAYMLLSEATEPVGVLITLHLLVFFVAALVCHGQLASETPAPSHLTEFYLWISIGGVLGGLFNTLASPVFFTRVIEYPAALILACWLVPASASAQSGRPWIWNSCVPAGAAILTLVTANCFLPVDRMPLQLRLGLAFGVPLLLCYGAVDRPARFALSLAAVMVTSSLFPGTHGRPLRMERNFFGVLRVTRDPIGPFYRLVHGNTIHGRQWIDPARKHEPLSYYHCTGPVGQIIKVYNAKPASPYVGIVGLGAGSMAGYARPSEHWTFYEINPAVASVARDTNYFTFLADCAAQDTEVILGDARLRLRAAPPAHYGLLVLDAFSSDAIPLHLITREALSLYLSKLAPGGLLVFHISNRCLELQEVLGDLAGDAQLVCHAQDESDPDLAEIAGGKDQSHWLVMSRRREDLGHLTRDSRWLPVPSRPQRKVWTDDFSNLVSVFKWR